MNRTKPGPGIGPTWKELIESGELQRILNHHVRNQGDKGIADRKPIFGKIPADWSELTREQKKAWSLEFLRAAKGAAGEGDRPQHTDETCDEPNRD